MKQTKELSIEEELLQHYTPDQLRDIFEIHLRQFLTNTPALFRDWNLNEKEFSGLTVRIREIVRLIAILCSDEKLFTQWYQKLPYMVSKVLETIVWEGKQELAELEQRTKGDLELERPEKKLNQDRLNPHYCLFFLFKLPKDKQNGDYVYYFDLPLSVRKKLKSYFPKPKGYTLKPLRSPQETDFTFSDQQKILHLFPLVLEYLEQGNLEQTKSGAPRKSAITRLSRYTEVEEFYPGHADSHLKTLRIERLVLLCLFYSPQSSSRETSEHLRSIICQLEEQSEDLLIPLLNHLKGWHQLPVPSNSLKGLIHLLRELPVQKWISLKQLKRFMLLHDIKRGPVNEKEAADFLNLPLDWQGWGHTKQQISPDLYAETVTDPWLKTAFGLFATLGLLDLKYNQPVNNLEIDSCPLPYLTAFDGLQYIRLTELGAYSLSLSDQFHKAVDPKETAVITPDEERLILTLSQPDAAITMKLEKISERVGSRLFKVDSHSFLSGCLGQSDIQNNILMLRDLIKSPLPPLWEMFFQELINKTDLIDSVNDAIIFKLDPNDEGLVDILTNDQEIRQLIYLAENYHIIVKKEDLQNLKEKLKNFGYLF